jgi:hypothetical protein
MSEFILVVLVIILLFSAFRRYIFLFLFRSLSDRLTEQMKKQQGNATGNAKPEGTVTIDTSKVKKKQRNDDDGDYVPYEEIK